MAAEHTHARRDSSAAGVPSNLMRDVPWQIWVVVAMLALEGLGNLASIPSNPVAAYWLACKCLFIVGLIRRWRWVFVVFLIVAAIHVLAFSTQVPFVAFLNLTMMLLVASTLRCFFVSHKL